MRGIEIAFKIYVFYPIPKHGDLSTMYRTIDNFDLIGLLIAFISFIRVALG